MLNTKIVYQLIKKFKIRALNLAFVFTCGKLAFTIRLKGDVRYVKEKVYDHIR